MRPGGRSQLLVQQPLGSHVEFSFSLTYSVKLNRLNFSEDYPCSICYNVQFLFVIDSYA